jgi:trimeric autotransporter adhesin
MSGSLKDLILSFKLLQQKVLELEANATNMRQKIAELQRRADAVDSARQAEGDYYPIYNSTIWIVPANVTKIRIDAYGAGGWGGDYSSVTGYNGAGGTGGGYGSVIMNVNPGDSFNVTIPPATRIQDYYLQPSGHSVVHYLNGNLTLVALRGADGTDGNFTACYGCSSIIGTSSTLVTNIASVKLQSLFSGGAGPSAAPFGGEGAGPLGGAGGIFSGRGAFPGGGGAGGIADFGYVTGGTGGAGFVIIYCLN